MTPLDIAREMVALADHHRAERGTEDSEADRVARELLRLHAENERLTRELQSARGFGAAMERTAHTLNEELKRLQRSTTP